MDMHTAHELSSLPARMRLPACPRRRMGGATCCCGSWSGLTCARSDPWVPLAVEQRRAVARMRPPARRGTSCCRASCYGCNGRCLQCVGPGGTGAPCLCVLLSLYTCGAASFVGSGAQPGRADAASRSVAANEPVVRRQGRTCRVGVLCGGDRARPTRMPDAQARTGLCRVASSHCCCYCSSSTAPCSMLHASWCRNRCY